MARQAGQQPHHLQISVRSDDDHSRNVGSVLMQDINEAAKGHWPSILGALAGLSQKQLDRQAHGSCPLCAGTDRYRFDDQDGSGSWFCNKCGGKTQSGGAGSGMDMLMRKNNWDFKRAASEVERHLGIAKARPEPPTKMLRRFIATPMTSLSSGGSTAKPAKPSASTGLTATSGKPSSQTTTKKQTQSLSTTSAKSERPPAGLSSLKAKKPAKQPQNTSQPSPAPLGLVAAKVTVKLTFHL